jgi:P-loop Domain of unknown function (DUF2791)
MNQDLATKIIESLRSGIPTRDSTRNLTNIRNPLHLKFASDLNQLASSQVIPKGRLIWGQFGQGKTHELTSLEHKALDQGFAVSRITINRQLSGQRLDYLYRKLAASIRTPNSNLFGIRHVLDKKKLEDFLNSEIQNPNRYTHPLPATILETYFRASAEDQDILYDSLLGSPVPLVEIKRIYKNSYAPSFPKFDERFTPTKHSQSYFELMADILKWCGYHGWVILIDEIELIHRLPKLSRIKAYQNLNWLLNWSDLLTFPIYTVGAVTDSLITLWLIPQGRSKLADSDMIPILIGERGDAESEQAMRRFFKYARDNDISPSIERISEKDLQDLLVKIAEIHGISYGWQPDIDVDSVIRSQGSSPVRLYIRALMETLDMEYLGDREFVPQLTALEELTVSEDESYFNDVE